MMAEALRRTAEKAAGDDGLQIGDITIHRLADIDRIPWPIDAMFSNDADGLIRGAHKLLPPVTFDPDGRRLSLSFNAFVIETPDFVCLVDAGIGQWPDSYRRVT
jgi:hypothetical protein